MTYDEQRAAILADLEGKKLRQDWHGVSDAANDLRELEARQESGKTVTLKFPESPIIFVRLYRGPNDVVQYLSLERYEVQNNVVYITVRE